MLIHLVKDGAKRFRLCLYMIIIDYIYIYVYTMYRYIKSTYIYIIIDVAFLLNPHPHPIHPQVGAVRSLRHRHHQGQRLAWHQPDDPSDASDWLCLAAAEPHGFLDASHVVFGRRRVVWSLEVMNKAVTLVILAVLLVIV